MPSGRPDWFGTIVAAGKYDDTYLPIALDVDGFITATMKGAYDAVLKTIAVDSNGIMKANLYAQDMDFLTVRPAYGQAIRYHGSKTVVSGEYPSLLKVSGRGVILGGYFYWATASTSKDLIIYLNIDDVLVSAETTQELHLGNLYRQKPGPVYVLIYDDDNFKYRVAFTWGITFESSFEILAHHTFGSNIQVDSLSFWALVPS